ncbi:hypothetical protein J9345_14955 [Bacillus subtilis subsp. subtilis]|uniref:hypothetical protein n=2 Tax=Bacillati TaxID=1783272 RepID=UPI001AECAD31|nr:hypothetical protein [Bacillus subtilis]MBP3047921.1 hypothetical protein [Bacillus subtilis subsp. subtilis]MEC1264346.1 hypothetical protein [Bacillus subtilis]
MKKHEEELKSRILGDRDMFAYYLKEVLENELIENAAALGIARLIIDKGAEELTDKQWYTFLRHGVGDINYVPHCRRDYERIPWEEMLAAVHIEEDELCSYCRHKEEKGE